MDLCRLRIRTCATALAWLAAVGTALADPPSKEVWPEIDTWLRLSPAWRVSLFVPIAENLDTHYREGNLIPQVDYAFGEGRFQRRLMDEDRARHMRFFLLRGGYLGGKSLDDQGEAYTEYTAFGEMHWRLPLKGGFLLSHRLRTELRWLGKDSHEFSNRWRYRFMVEKEFGAGRLSFVPYANVEPYYDSRYETVNRVRLIAGSSVAWSTRTALEVNGTYQYDSRSSTKEILAASVILHVFFDASRAP
ncbi:MAG: hypothetical protein H6Q10_3386 [Acidobacteria bacterium]|nr:hypothetical protein [Acidobacteriota bacterium]